MKKRLISLMMAAVMAGSWRAAEGEREQIQRPRAQPQALSQEPRKVHRQVHRRRMPRDSPPSNGLCGTRT